jgi:hypothetical protein
VSIESKVMDYLAMPYDEWLQQNPDKVEDRIAQGLVKAALGGSLEALTQVKWIQADLERSRQADSVIPEPKRGPGRPKGK